MKFVQTYTGHLLYFQKDFRVYGEQCMVVQPEMFLPYEELMHFFKNGESAPDTSEANEYLNFQIQRAYARDVPDAVATQIAAETARRLEASRPGYTAEQLQYESDYTDDDFTDIPDPVVEWEEEFGGRGGDAPAS